MAFPVSLFEECAASTPNLTAVGFGGRSFSYRELNRLANGLAHDLLGGGLGPGDLIALVLPRSQVLIAAMLAVLKTGAAYLPLDPSYPASRVANIVGDAKPGCVITSDSFHGDFTVSGARLMHIDGDRVPGAASACADRNPADADRPRPLHPDDPMYVIYTSGSTGTPKGISMSQRGVSSLLGWHRNTMPVTPTARVAQFTAISFDFSIQEIFATLTNSKTLVVPADDVRNDLVEFVRWLAREEITELYGSTAALAAVFAIAAEYGVRLPHLCDVFQGGENLVIDGTIRSACERSRFRMHNIYGPAEAPYATSHSLTGDPAGWPSPVPIGRPATDMHVVLLDSTLAPAPTASVGEIYISGPLVAHGYWGRPAETAQRFLADPAHGYGARMYRTGDLARYNQQGELEFIGRVDDQVKIRGYRVEPAEIEAALVACPDVTQAAVVPRATGHSGESLVAYFTGNADPRQLRSALNEMLPSYMVPSAFVRIGRFPLTPNGKLDRRMLPDPMAGQPDDACRPTNPGERLICQIFSEYLGVPVGPADNFVALGGQSLLATRIINRISRDMNAELSMRLLFEAPSIGDIAAELDRQQN
jgi:amino acid adenylation domain-containing protein